MAFFILYLKIVLWWWCDPHNSCSNCWFLSWEKFHHGLYVCFPLLFFWMNYISFFNLFRYFLWRGLQVSFPFPLLLPLPHLTPPHPASSFPHLMASFFSLWITGLNCPQIISSEWRVFPSHDMIFFFFLKLKSVSVLINTMQNGSFHIWCTNQIILVKPVQSHWF